MNPSTVESNAGNCSSFSRNFFDFVAKLRFVTVSFFIHSIVVLLCGSAVLFKVVQPPDDFVSDGAGALVEESTSAVPPPEAVQSSEHELTSDPTVGLEVMSTSTSSASFVIPVAKITSMDGKAISDIASKIEGAAKGLAGTGGGGKVGGTMKFMGVQATGTSVVFVVDVSGSMVNGTKSVKTYEVLEREVAKFIHTLDDRSAFGIVVFSHDAKSFKQNLVRANREEKERAVNWLKKLSPEAYVDPKSSEEERAFHRGTRADRGLAEAFELKPDIIFFVSDGEPTGATPAQILKQVEQSQGSGKKTAINSVAYLADSGQKFMRELAEKNGGTFREVNPRDVK